MFGQTDIMLLLKSCYRQMTKSSLFFQNTPKFSFGSANLDSHFFSSFRELNAGFCSIFFFYLFHWPHCKCSVWIGNCISKFLMWKYFGPSKRKINATLFGHIASNWCHKTLKICGIHIRRNIKGATTGWVPKCCGYILGMHKRNAEGCHCPLQREAMDSTWGSHWAELLGAEDWPK